MYTLRRRVKIVLWLLTGTESDVGGLFLVGVFRVWVIFWARVLGLGLRLDWERSLSRMPLVVLCCLASIFHLTGIGGWVADWVAGPVA